MNDNLADLVEMCIGHIDEAVDKVCTILDDVSDSLTTSKEYVVIGASLKLQNISDDLALLIQLEDV